MTDSPHIHLASEDTEPITKSSQPLSHAKIDDLKKSLFTWDLVDVDGETHLCNEYRFATNAETNMFVDRVNKLADAHNHHPKTTVEDRLVTIHWWTHDLGGLHRNDFIMAAKTQEIFENWSEITGRKDTVDVQSEESFPASDAPGNY